MGSAEHSSSSRYYRCKGHETYGLSYIVVDSFHPALHEISFMPEACATGVTQKFFPPFAMRGGTSPGKKRLRVAPVLTHACVHGKEREEKIFVEQQTIRRNDDGVRDLGAKAEERLETSQ